MEGDRLISAEQSKLPPARSPEQPVSQRPWVVRARQAWTAAVPILLWITTIAFHGTQRYMWIGVGFVIVGQILRIWAAGCIHKNDELATGGPYALTRNPLYFGSFLIGVGYSLLSGFWQTVVLVPLLFWLFYLPTIRYEEQMLRASFGSELDAYCAYVPRFFPRLPRRQATLGGFSWRLLLIKNHEWKTALANAVGTVIFLVR